MMPHLTREEIIAFTQRVTKDMEFLNAALEESIKDAATADWLKIEYQSLSYSLRKAMPNIKEDAECIEKSVVTLDDEDKEFIAPSSTISQASSSSRLAGVDFTGSPVPTQFAPPRFGSSSPPRRTSPATHESASLERLPTSMSPIYEGKRKRTDEFFSVNVQARCTIRSPPSPAHETNSNRIPPLARPWGPGPTTPDHISNSPNYAPPAPSPHSPNTDPPSHSSQDSPFSALLPPRHLVFSPSPHVSPPSPTQEDDEQPHPSFATEPNTFIHMPAPHRPTPSLTHSLSYTLDSALTSSSRPPRALVPAPSQRHAAPPFPGGRGNGATHPPASTSSAFRSPAHPSAAAASAPERRDARSRSPASAPSSPPPPAQNEPWSPATKHAAELDLLLLQEEARRERRGVSTRLDREAILRSLHGDGGLCVELEGGGDDDEVEFVMGSAREASLDGGFKSDSTTVEEGARERKRKAQPCSSERASVRRQYV